MCDQGLSREQHLQFWEVSKFRGMLLPGLRDSAAPVCIYGRPILCCTSTTGDVFPKHASKGLSRCGGNACCRGHPRADQGEARADMGLLQRPWAENYDALQAATVLHSTCLKNSRKFVGAVMAGNSATTFSPILGGLKHCIQW
jgi:hypothetical protein